MATLTPDRIPAILDEMGIAPDDPYRKLYEGYGKLQAEAVPANNDWSKALLSGVMGGAAGGLWHASAPAGQGWQAAQAGIRAPIAAMHEQHYKDVNQRDNAALNFGKSVFPLAAEQVGNRQKRVRDIEDKINLMRLAGEPVPPEMEAMLASAKANLISTGGTKVAGGPITPSAPGALPSLPMPRAPTGTQAPTMPHQTMPQVTPPNPGAPQVPPQIPTAAPSAPAAPGAPAVAAPATSSGVSAPTPGQATLRRTNEPNVVMKHADEDPDAVRLEESYRRAKRMAIASGDAKALETVEKDFAKMRLDQRATAIKKSETNPEDAKKLNEAKAMGTALGEAKSAYPGVEKTAYSLLRDIDDALGDPKLNIVTGSFEGHPWVPNISENANRAQSRIDKLKGKNFLMAFASLKGGGAITEVEGKKASEAMARIDNQRQGDADYQQAIKEIRNEVIADLNAQRTRAGLEPLPPEAVMQQLKKFKQETTAPDDGKGDKTKRAMTDDELIATLPQSMRADLPKQSPEFRKQVLDRLRGATATVDQSTAAGNSQSEAQTLADMQQQELARSREAATRRGAFGQPVDGY